MIADLDPTFALAMVTVVIVIVIVGVVGHAMVAIPALTARTIAVLLHETSAQEPDGYQGD